MAVAGLQTVRTSIPSSLIPRNSNSISHVCSPLRLGGSLSFLLPVLKTKALTHDQLRFLLDKRVHARARRVIIMVCTINLHVFISGTIASS